jgi:ABC-2 type transport system permease protein
MWAMFRARNHEFFRDRAAFGWNFLFPFLLVAGFGLIFGSRGHQDFKVGLFPSPAGEILSVSDMAIPTFFKTAPQIEFAGFATRKDGLFSLRHHKIDFLLQTGGPPHRYWINDSSPKGILVESLFKAGLIPPEMSVAAIKGAVQGREVRYIDWLFPGILTMNMMFSALWGVGFVVVRYRKNGVLKRLKATPVTALEYMTAQMLSRIFLLMFTTVIVWVGSDLIFSFHVEGSYLDLFLVFFLGSMSLTALGLVVASRGTSEEFTSGLLNFIGWPMMFLSGVWFSLEGAPRWIRLAAEALPLTHMLRAVRRIMNEGAGMAEVGPEMAVLGGMTLGFLLVGAALFSWNR